MIGRAEAMETPERAGQNNFGELLAFAPPVVPNPAQISVRAGLGARQINRQKSAHAEQARLQRENRRTLFRFSREQARHQLGQAAHRPDVVFVAEPGEEAFPQRLLPTGLPGAGGKLRGLALEPD